MDQLLSLRVFRQVVEAGSFVAAAERLSLSAPMVSKHLAQLERRLGVRLLQRTSRQLNLTSAGSHYYARCCQALDTLDEAASEVGLGASEPAGELKVSAPVWCANPRFAQLLVRYRQHHPAVTLDLHLDNRRVDLVAEGFDLALRATHEPSPALIARPLCRVDFVLVATPALAQRLAGEQVLPAVLPNYVSLDRLLASGEGAMPRLAPVMKSSDTNLSHQAVLAGLGVGLLPQWLIDDDIAAGRLQRIDVPPPPVQATLFAVYTSRRQMPPKLRTFIDFLGEALG